MPKPKATTSVRDTLVLLMKATVADHANWRYLEVRPLLPPPSWKKGQKVTADCSKGVQYLCRWAGAPDPMGSDFSSWGNSTTIRAHLVHLDKPSDLQPGD